MNKLIKSEYGLAWTCKTSGIHRHKGSSQPPTGSSPQTSPKYSGQRSEIGQKTREKLLWVGWSWTGTLKGTEGTTSWLDPLPYWTKASSCVGAANLVTLTAQVKTYCCYRPTEGQIKVSCTRPARCKAKQECHRWDQGHWESPTTENTPPLRTAALELRLW